jgi:hypothetical protein
MTECGLPPEPHSDDLTLLHTGIHAVLATNLDSLSVAELLDRACKLQKLSAQIDAARATVLAAADTASEAPGVLRELGFATPRKWWRPKPGRRPGRSTPPPAPGDGSMTSRSSPRRPPTGC